MNLKTINVIIKREYLTRVKKKSFLFVTFLGPIFFAALTTLPTIIMFMAKEDSSKVAVVDNSGIIMPKLEDTETISYYDCSGQDVDSLKTTLSKEYDALLVISELDTEKAAVSALAYSDSPMSVDMKESMARQIDNAIEDYRVAQYEIDDLKSIMENVKSRISISTYTLSDGEEKISSSEVYMMLSLILSIIIYMFIAMFSGMVMQSVIEEKTSRVVEVLVSSVKATELMFGKIIGVACVALTQFFLWIVLTGAIVTGVTAFVDLDSMAGVTTMQTEQMTQMASGLGVDQEALEASGMAMPSVEAVAEDTELGAIISTLREINYVQLIIAFIVYFVLGYLLYASLFAAIGSAVENEADTQQLSIPITIPLLLAFFIAFYAFKAPDSQIVFWGSIIPFTSPIVMLARIPFGVPTWELILSISLLLITFIIMAWLSAKIYRIGILMFGKKSTFKDLYKWLKQK